MGKFFRIIGALPSIILVFVIDAFFLDGIEMVPAISETFLLPLITIIMTVISFMMIVLKQKRKLILYISFGVLIVLTIILGTFWGFDDYYDLYLTAFLIYFMCAPLFFIFGLTFLFSRVKKEILIFIFAYLIVYGTNMVLMTIYGEIGVFFLLFFIPGFIGFLLVVLADIKWLKKKQRKSNKYEKEPEL
jgi:hypothetical protein